MDYLDAFFLQGSLSESLADSLDRFRLRPVPSDGARVSDELSHVICSCQGSSRTSPRGIGAGTANGVRRARHNSDAATTLSCPQDQGS